MSATPLPLPEARPRGQPSAARLSAGDILFRALTMVAVIEIAIVGLNIIAHPQSTGLIGQGLLVRVWLGLIIGPVLVLFGGLILWRVPGTLTGRFLILIALGAMAMELTVDLGTPTASALAAEAIIMFTLTVVGPSLGYMMLTFPTGRVYPPRWTGAVIVAGLVKSAGVVLEVLASPVPIKIFTLTVNPLFVPALAPWRPIIAATIGLTGGLFPLIVLAGLVSLGLRYRAAPSGERQQIKWVMWGFGVLTPLAMLVLLAAFRFGTHSAIFQVGVVFAAAGQVVFLSSLAISVLRYRLFDIDLLINRTLVYGSLTVIVVGVYVVAVGYLSELFRASGSFILSLLATGLIAVSFQPLRQRLQRFVNRLLYGERDDPYAVLSALGQRLEAIVAPEAVLPTLAETIAQTLRLPYVAVTLDAAGEGQPQTVAAYGLPAAGGPAAHLPLAYHGEHMGELLIAPRGPGESFSPAEQRLLGDIARQAGVAAHAVRLNADLQRSRERLVSAQEEGRRRLRRDLHDGLGPHLASQTLTLAAARRLLYQHPAEADALLAEAIKHAQAAVSDIRRVVYDLRPPALDDLGLAGALRAQAASFEASGVGFDLRVPETLPPLPAAVEVAGYRIAQEALTNVVRHAAATHCTLTLSLDHGAAPRALALEVSDDGRGLPADCQAGVGLGSMRERAAELGGQCTIEPGPAGGTRVLARLPIG